MSRADRPYGRFPAGDRAPERPSPDDRVARASRGRALARGIPEVVAIVGGLALLLFAFSLMFAPPAMLTTSDVDGAVHRVLASQTPSPPPGIAIYQQVAPSVVHISATVPRGGGSDRFAGSGVILDVQGRILTNEHVIRGASSVTVTFADGFSTSATLLRATPENDIALLQADRLPPTIVPATLGDPRVRVGEPVYVIGDPMNLTRSFSAGVVSGLDRSFQSTSTGRTLSGLIQFDAAVNPGNSGGPLIDGAGDVVGIVTGLANPGGIDAFSGIGFAVPIDAAASAAGSPEH